MIRTHPPIADIFESLPHGEIELFEEGGQSIFPMYAPSGNLMNAYVFYLMRKTEGGHNVLGVRISSLEFTYELARKLLGQAISKFDELAKFTGKYGEFGIGLTEEQVLEA
jgi:hypothetical protein